MQKVHKWKSKAPCCKVTTFKQEILVLLEFPFLCPRDNFGKYFMLEAYFDI